MINYVTFINVVATFAVLLLHTNACFWQFSATDRYWTTANIIESVFYFGVPLFFMLTGITLIDYKNRYSTRTFIFKRLTKTIIPYLSWSLLVVLFRLFYLKNLSFTQLKPAFWLYILANGEATHIYWFFIPLFSCYFLIMLISFFTEKTKKRLFVSLSLAMFLFNSLFPFLFSLFAHSVNYPASVKILLANGYFFWVMIGWLLSRWHPSNRCRYLIYVISIASLFIFMEETYRLSISRGEIVGLYKGYNNLLPVLYSAGVFIFLRELGLKLMKHEKVKKGFVFLAHYSFIVYLLQWFVMQIIIHEKLIDTRSIFYRVLFPIVIYAVAIVLAQLMRKISFLKILVPT